MNEIDEIVSGKNHEQLVAELNFQIKNGESEGGIICSRINEEINKLKN